MLAKRKVYLGSHMSPLPPHLLAVCESAILEKHACPPGHRLLTEQMCAVTAPMVEGGNCGKKSVRDACIADASAAATVRCPGLCAALLGWYCGLSDWDAGLVTTGQAPGSVPPPPVGTPPAAQEPAAPKAEDAAVVG